jgi:hypothetical protein
MDEENLTPEEEAELKQLLGGASPVPDEKHNVHTFISNVFKSKDTTKVGNLKEEEIGMMRNPVRAYKEGAIFAKDIMHCHQLSEYFLQEAEVTTSTSLSRNAALLRFATTTTRQIGDVTKTKTQNKSWFKSKNKSEGGEM